MENQQQVQLMQLLNGMMRSQAIYTAAKLDIADKLGDSRKSISQLAQETQTHEASLYRLLRALASIGVFTEESLYTFTNTAFSSLLRSDHPDSLRDMARFLGSKVFWNSWGLLDYSVKTGEQAFHHVFHENIWSYFYSHPEDAEIFNRAMTSITEYEDVALREMYDFSSKIIADIGGGHGGLLTGILTKYATARGILFDTVSVIEQAEECFLPQLQERVLFVAGSFFGSVPVGGDIYLLKNILHNWPDEQCITILQNCRKAMAPDGKVLVIERVIPETADPDQAETFFVDLIMLAMFGGYERSRKQMEQLYTSAGLRLTRLIATGAQGIHILEGIAAD